MNIHEYIEKSANSKAYLNFLSGKKDDAKRLVRSNLVSIADAFFDPIETGKKRWKNISLGLPTYTRKGRQKAYKEGLEEWKYRTGKDGNREINPYWTRMKKEDRRKRGLGEIDWRRSKLMDVIKSSPGTVLGYSPYVYGGYKGTQKVKDYLQDRKNKK